MKFRALIIEDREKHYNKIKDVLLNTDKVEVVGSYLGPYPFEKAILHIRYEAPNLLVIDYDLNEDEDKTGLELYNSVATAGMFVIFHSQFPAVQHIDKRFLNAVFIEKYSEEDVLQAAFEDVLFKAEGYFNIYRGASLLHFDTEEGTAHISCHDIVYLESQGKNTVVHLKGGKAHLVRGLLGSFMDHPGFPTVGFVRIHNKYIINTYEVVDVRFNDSYFSKKVVVMETSDTEVKKLPFGRTFFNDPTVTALIKRRKKRK